MGYKDIAQERAAVRYLQRYTLNNFIASDSPAKEVGICEEVFVNDQVITQDVWHRVFARLQRWEGARLAEMNEFKWIKDDQRHPFEDDDIDDVPPTPKDPVNDSESKEAAPVKTKSKRTKKDGPAT